MSVLYKIKSSINAFTDTEYVIADFILKNRQLVLDFNAKELGDVTKTSASAWVRFAKKMG